MLHSHTQFCDGHAPMHVMAEAAFAAGLPRYGFSPHSPIPIPSPCNMKMEDVDLFIREADRLKDEYASRMEILTGMEIDFLGADWGPQTEYFASLPLDYRIGSVHFVRTQHGELIDCDGSAERFARNLSAHFQSDLRYIVDTYYAAVKEMLSFSGSFDILGHFDKIGLNAAAIEPDIESADWYHRHIEEVIDLAKRSRVTVEINTKAYRDKGRFFPHERWWPQLKASTSPIIFNSDAHYPDRVTAGLSEARTLFHSL